MVIEFDEMIMIGAIMAVLIAIVFIKRNQVK